MSDYGGLRAITEEAKQMRREDQLRPLVDCPVCGTTLDKNERGAVNCPLGHFWRPSDRRQDGDR